MCERESVCERVCVCEREREREADLLATAAGNQVASPRQLSIEPSRGCLGTVGRNVAIPRAVGRNVGMGEFADRKTMAVFQWKGREKVNAQPITRKISNTDNEKLNTSQCKSFFFSKKNYKIKK